MKAFLHVNAKPGRLRDLYDELPLIPGVVTTYVVTGMWDFILFAEVKDADGVRDLVNEVGRLAGVEKILGLIVLAQKSAES